MGLAVQLWQENVDLATACLDHPFVQGIGNGSLPRDRFQDYVGQDAFFLEAFARAYSIAAAKAPDWEGFQVFHHLAAGVLQELSLHQTYAATWEIDLRQVQPSSATRAYTDFLLATAWSQPIGITAAAMSPCMKLYAYLGDQLAQGGIPTHVYSDWIITYSGAEFRPLVEQLDYLTNQHGAGLVETATTYRYAMQCELNFFQAAWSGA